MTSKHKTRKEVLEWKSKGSNLFSESAELVIKKYKMLWFEQNKITIFRGGYLILVVI